MLVHATYTNDGNSSLDDVVTVVCNESYRVFEMETNTQTAACQVDHSGLVAEWCWVPPCERMYF